MYKREDDKPLFGDDATTANAIGFLLSLVAVVLNGFIVASVWGWFIAPLGLMAITPLHAIGIVVFLALVKENSSDVRHKPVTFNNRVKFPIVVMFTEITLWAFAGLLSAFM